MSRYLTLLCLSLLLSVGCGRRDESLAEVKGDITFCGQPAVAEVLFEPLKANGQSGGRASTATSAADGRFRLALDETQNGAKIGQHRVTIRVQQIERPKNNESGTKTGERMIGALKVVQLAREVHSGTNQFYFRLTF
ncbi:MAG: hypothetical protein NT013_09600 [Planctomycetia bacterium]|nr:hypothetical protein [Planctomycetia bacterium]